MLKRAQSSERQDMQKVQRLQVPVAVKRAHDDSAVSTRDTRARTRAQSRAEQC